MSPDQYAGLAAGAADRPVMDQTGLQGEYLFPVNALMRERTRYSVELARGRQPNADGTLPEASEPGMALLDLVKEIGLTLEPRKVSMALLVIERASQPSEN